MQFSTLPPDTCTEHAGVKDSYYTFLFTIPVYLLLNLSFIVSLVLLSNWTFFWYASGANISGEFGRAMVRMLGSTGLARIPMVRSNEPDVLPKRTKKDMISYYRTKIRPGDMHDIVATSGHPWLDIAGYQESRHGFWLANCQHGYDERRYQTQPSMQQDLMFIAKALKDRRQIVDESTV